MIKTHLETALFTRKALLKIMVGLSEDQLQKIPQGFKNSIFWNIAHLLVTPQLLWYKRCGLPMKIDDDFASRYAKGTAPSKVIPEGDLEYLKKHLLETIDLARKDLESGTFKEYDPYMTSTGIELNSIEKAMEFSGFHDGIHLGIVLSQRKLV